MIAITTVNSTIPRRHATQKQQQQIEIVGKNQPRGSKVVVRHGTDVTICYILENCSQTLLLKKVSQAYIICHSIFDVKHLANDTPRITNTTSEIRVILKNVLHFFVCFQEGG